jgi:3-hydroxyisobutyrate dehydrogenase
MTSDVSARATAPAVPEPEAVAGVPATGFIGLGSQGGPIARRIVDAGASVTLWARRAETLEPFRGTAAQWAASPVALARRSEIVGVCVLDDAGVESVVLGENGVLAGLAPGGILVIHSTVHPDLCVRLAEVAARQHVQVVDAPVSGGGPAAERGELVVMAGGDPEAVRRCAPLFALFGDPVLHLGPVGSGQRAKLLNNLMLAANMGVAESAFALAKSLNIDLAQLSVLLSRGSGRSYGAALLRGPDFDLAASASKAGPLLRKDVGLLVDLARSAGVEPGAVLDAADRALSSMGLPRPAEKTDRPAQSD